MPASSTYSAAIPTASRTSDAFVRCSAYCWKSRTAIAVDTIAERTMPARKIAGRRNRRELNERSTVPRVRRSETGTSLRGGRRVARGADLVADAPDRDDRRRVSQLAAELPHVDVHRAGIAGERVPPDALEQLVARQHEAAVVEQLPEQVELLRRELDLLVAHLALAAAGVDREVAMVEHLGLRVAPLRGRAPQNGLDARDELARVERLRQVVVGADLEPDDLLDVLVARRQHQDRH